MPGRLEADAASALCKGARDYQEDALVADFSRGSDVGLVVLADGMGGHAAGDVASKIVVTEVFSELMFRRGDAERFAPEVPKLLHAAAMTANACLRAHVQACPETRGMGATLVACVLLEQSLYWISIGDSPLFLFREGSLRQLNQDHSMAPQIDFMVKSGLIAPEAGARHPDRNTLTSVLFGEDIPKIDCPQTAFGLQDGDILIAASDGLQFLSDREIEAVLHEARNRPSTEIVARLLDAVLALEDPDLDNVSFSVVKLAASEAASGSARPPEIRRVG